MAWRELARFEIQEANFTSVSLNSLSSDFNLTLQARFPVWTDERTENSFAETTAGTANGIEYGFAMIVEYA